MNIIQYHVNIPYPVDCDAHRTPIGGPFTEELTRRVEFLNPLVTIIHNVDDVRAVDSKGFRPFELPVAGSYSPPLQYE